MNIYNLRYDIFDIIIEISEEIGIDVIFDGIIQDRKRMIFDPNCGMPSISLSMRKGTNIHRIKQHIFLPLFAEDDLIREKLPEALLEAEEEAKKCEIIIPCWDKITQERKIQLPKIRFLTDFDSGIIYLGEFQLRQLAILHKMTFKGHKFLLCFENQENQENHSKHFPVIKFPISALLSHTELPRQKTESLYICMGEYAEKFEELICTMQIKEAIELLKLFLLQTPHEPNCPCVVCRLR